MTILTSTTLAADGLTRTPSCTLTLANTSVQKTTTPVAGSLSIDRIYRFSGPVLFSGTAGINYLPSALNGFPEANLQLACASVANIPLTTTSPLVVRSIRPCTTYRIR